MKKIIYVLTLSLGPLAWYQPNSANAADAKGVETTSSGPGPLTLIHSTPLPDIVGDFDHFAVDRKGNQLFVSAEVHHSIEVFDLKTGEHVRSAPVAKIPHTLAFDEKNDRLIVADGGDDACLFLNGKDLSLVKRVQLGADPDAGLFDPKNHLFYVGNGGKPGKLDYSTVSILNVDDMSVVNQVRVEAANLEAMALDRAANRLYVNMRDKKQIAVIDLAAYRVADVWTIPDLNLNTTMSLDEPNHRLFVAGRKPGKLFIISTTNGSLVTTLDCSEIADDSAWDPKTHRLFETGAGGVTVYKQQDPDHYQIIAQFDTKHGKTSEYVPALHQFYIIHTKTPDDIAGLQVYKVNQ
jgi:DNA-binding beta-propeller fold protein YncE